ncbi:hypothetical protein K9U39_14670 [Rhodoblastus acidophilus]|uniref:Uncharacterized protein n=1 Tax=Candidatus Rhodoblastus alkanivorans TaxID=2954117 RepID=A0ABS9ZB20_9HYPH|nr:hypothetical protein [Candidatus Rhodoblastus alkanivorans]MCI4679372.1 hypothetical protein [Candidatus Rhodoblastus alkanivorans]MCI4684848.1 hypothetical protein [Candidatus Rhodoblastus alkanivorans]MDI4642172.1 hypothetical protein [Rhodoblastus acidophilus]
MTLLREKSKVPVSDKVKTDRSLDPMPPAGPHDRPELTNYDACPGAGMFPAQVGVGIESDPGGG